MEVKDMQTVADLQRSETLRNMVLSGDGTRIPHNGCDLNHNEDRG